MKLEPGGGVIRDSIGNMVLGFALYLGIASSIFAETKAIWLGMLFAKQLELTDIWLESDSEILVKCLNGSIEPPWSVVHIYYDIVELINSFNSFKVSHIHREGNFAADGFAN